ncbi:MAG: PaaI family thioesterase [Burkholderiaceae bacterium]
MAQLSNTGTWSSPMALETLQAALSEFFAPWVQQLGLRAEALRSEGITLRLPFTPQLARSGGMACGQALMAAADTAAAIALMRHFGQFRPCTTVQLNTSFLRPLSSQDALVNAKVLRAGKSLAFIEVDIRGAMDGETVARASTTYALL